MLVGCSDTAVFWAITENAGYELSRADTDCFNATWSPDSRWLQAEDALIDPFTGQIVHRWAPGLVYSSWSPDNRRFAGITLGGNPMLLIADVYSGEELLRMVLPQPANDVAWSPDGSMIAVCYEDGSIQIWRVDQ
jgi:Tol biopolymer transport system component